MVHHYDSDCVNLVKSTVTLMMPLVAIWVVSVVSHGCVVGKSGWLFRVSSLTWIALMSAAVAFGPR